MSYRHDLLCAFIVLEFCTTSKGLQPGYPHFVFIVNTRRHGVHNKLRHSLRKGREIDKISAFTEHLVYILLAEPNNKRVSLISE